MASRLRQSSNDIKVIGIPKLLQSADDALPALRELLKDPDRDVRSAAAQAIRRIEGG